MQPILLEKREEIAELCRRHHVERLDVFGSAVRDDFDPEKSDFDFLVEFRPLNAVAYADNYFELQGALSSLLARPVDIMVRGTIRNPFLRQAVEQGRRQIYAA